jgi:hypothetical protein
MAPSGGGTELASGYRVSGCGARVGMDCGGGGALISFIFVFDLT